MSIKKYSSGSWVTVPYRKYETATDTITSLPKTIIGDGQPISSYTIKGNMSQSGTPTPSNPVYPAETGDKTANLFDKNAATIGYYVSSSTGDLVQNSPSMASDYIPIEQGQQYYWNDPTSRGNAGAFYDSNKTYISGWSSSPTKYVFTAPNGASYVRLTATASNIDNLQLNRGEAALDYEPFGYKIPILSNGTTYPAYLAEPIRKINTYADSLASSGTVSRSIKQVAFTGQEEWEHYGSSVFWTKVENNGVLVNGNGLSNSYIYNPTTSNVPTTIENGECGLTSSNGRVYIKNTNYANATAFKQYLADRYSAGTPVTVWYVLATATTETFTAPSIPTSGTAQTFDVDTTLAPSEVSLTYHGWHEHEDTEFT